MPALAVPYAAKCGPGICPATDAMLITEPPPAVSTICGAASWVIAKAVVTLKWKALSNSRTLVFSAAFGMEPPTLLTRMSKRPRDRTVCSTMFLRCASSVASSATTKAFCPLPRTTSATRSRSLSVRAPMATSAPASEKACAQAAPMPLPAPVISAHFAV